MNIEKKTRSELKSYFRKNAIPTEAEFADLIEGVIVPKDDGVVRLPGQPLSIEGTGADAKVLDLYKGFGDDKPVWSLKIARPAAQGRPAVACFDLSNADGESRLFVEPASGRVGIGTRDPGHAVDVQVGPRTRTHPENLPFYVTADCDPGAKGVEFRHSNGTQGLGFGYNTIYATGSNANQRIALAPRGTGGVEVLGSDVLMDKDRELVFRDNGQIRSSDDNHRILFRRTENTMELREFGRIVLSAGAKTGAETASVVVLPNHNVQMKGSLSLEGRLSTSKFRVTHVLNRTAGALPKQGTFRAGGGIVLLTASGSAFRRQRGMMHLRVQVDNRTRLQLDNYTNEGGSHKAFPTGFVSLGRLSAGNHTLKMVVGHRDTLTDGNDRFHATLLELPF